MSSAGSTQKQSSATQEALASLQSVESVAVSGSVQVTKSASQLEGLAQKLNTTLRSNLQSQSGLVGPVQF